ncbi:MAG: serine/threonine-protein kinase, partial [Myxococcota bacterium]|nr:serine/threonine-protein kinase [Myxococcota bacterium]
MIERPEQFGKYQLVERLAIGGMAEIFKATVGGLGGFERVVAIKRLHSHLSQDEELVQMLIDEARLAVRLMHANIGQVFDLGCINNQYFIVMEYITGADLHRISRRLREQNRKIPTPIVLYVMAEMLAGLDYAHNCCDDHGRPLDLVHRDISPQNIMFSTAGDVKLVDFGIAKARMQ